MRLRRFDRDVGVVLAAFVVLLAIENLVVGLGWRSEFVGTWEMGTARLYLSPIALALLVPVAVVIVLGARLAEADLAWAVGVGGAVSGLVVGYGLSAGRRMASLGTRVPFVAVLALSSAFVGWSLARRLPRARRSAVAAGGVGLAALGWLADAFVLPRLYPFLHLALFGLTLLGWAATALLVHRTRAATPVAWIGIVVAVASIAWSPHAAVRARADDNLRRVLLEHAPVLGRAVVVAARIAPPLPLDDDEGTATTTLATLRKKGDGRALDWTGHDIVVVTIDALRADHVSAYGYARRTTPNIDALAARGVRFEHAYCPTPHTSYSVTSMMTGKYMKPLLSLGAEDAERSETWALALRRYGYRTAAFYPPAVFFIDAHRFQYLESTTLGFEYAKVEFAKPELRRAQIERYLGAAPRDKPLFLWVHLFEPHEPYEMHVEHPFNSDPRVDAYDSEIATADEAVGDVVDLVTKKRPPGAIFFVSADHGEEHGDHGGRYHGTTVYEEQVRVPLVVVAPGVAPRTVNEPVQTIDLLPTSLAALDVPLPPRLRGRDLGPLLVGTALPVGEGLAFAETDDWTLVARGSDRLVCARKIASCTLFDVARDPAEKAPVTDRPDRVAELRKLTAAIERETGKVEASGLPEALRRGLQGDRDAAEEIAPLLDDARVEIRRLAARCAFRLAAPPPSPLPTAMTPQLRRALARDEDEEVRRWAALALVRLGDPLGVPAHDAGGGGGAGSLVESLVIDRSAPLEPRTAAALALAERGDARGEAELVARWSSAFGGRDGQGRGELDEARELLAALAKIRARSVVPALTQSLEDVRVRPYVVEALAEIGDARAKEPLFRTFAGERYLQLRAPEARALLRLGATVELLAPLRRFAGTRDPMVDALPIAHDAKLLRVQSSLTERPTRVADPTRRSLQFSFSWPGGPAKLHVLGEPGVRPKIRLSGGTPTLIAGGEGPASVYDCGYLARSDGDLYLDEAKGVRAVWLVPDAEEIPPPPPRAWVPPPTNEPPEDSDGGL